MASGVGTNTYAIIYLITAPILWILALIPWWGNESFLLLFWCTTVERGVVFSLVIFLLLILLFLSIYPVSLSRNILVHCVVYAVFFLGISTMTWIHDMLGFEVTLNTVELVMHLGCYAAWTFFLTQEAETRITMLRKTGRRPTSSGSASS
jgi:hypothetical protein